MIPADPETPSKVVDHISYQVKLEGRWQPGAYDPAKPHVEITLPESVYKAKEPVKLRTWNFLDFQMREHVPGNPIPFGWCLLKHKWNKGFSLSYNPWPQTSHEQMIPIEHPTSIEFIKTTIMHKRPFFSRKLPDGFMFTVAKLSGKWRVTRALNPWLEASLSVAPLQEDSELGSDIIE